MRPNGANELYIWLDGPANLIAKYHPEDDTFEVRTTRAPWGVLEMAFKKQADVLVRYCEEDVKMTEELFRKKAQEDFDRSNSPNV